MEQIQVEVRNVSERALLKEFSRQAERLTAIGYDAADLEPLRQKISNMQIPMRKGGIPFVIAVPAVIANPKLQMQNLILLNIRGYVRLPIQKIGYANGATVPNKPYLLVDVEPGLKTSGMTPERCTEVFKDQGRLGLTAEEGIALATQFPELFNVLEGGNPRKIYLPGATFGPESTLYVWRNEQGEIWLYCGWTSKVEPGGRSASCVNRIS
ncbi:MAG: hypothetical protein HYS87_00195 [Candidatus Colwellbacteria bacterium]|nr:hypothetical protein [Candidatus Colwellbacteria bacterium]